MKKEVAEDREGDVRLGLLLCWPPRKLHVQRYETVPALSRSMLLSSFEWCCGQCGASPRQVGSARERALRSLFFLVSTRSALADSSTRKPAVPARQRQTTLASYPHPPITRPYPREDRKDKTAFDLGASHPPAACCCSIDWENKGYTRSDCQPRSCTLTTLCLVRSRARAPLSESAAQKPPLVVVGTPSPPLSSSPSRSPAREHS
jgi:hypothetical protein